MSHSVFMDLRLRDYAGGVLKQFGNVARSVFTDVDRHVSHTQRGLNNLNEPVRLRVDTSDVERAGRDLDRVGRKIAEMPGFRQGAAASFVGNLGANAAEALVSNAIEQAKSVLDAGFTGSKLQSQFATMGGAPGLQLFETLSKYIDDSPLGASLYDNAVTLMNFGEAVKEVLPDLKRFGDVSGGSADKVGRYALAFGQTLGAGKLTGENNNQFIDAGFNPLREIARTTGKSYATLQKEMEAGKVTAEMVRQAFVTATSPGGAFYGMMDNMSQTPYGQLQALQGSVEGQKMRLGMELMPQVGGVMKEMELWNNELPKLLNELRPQLQGIVTDFADLLKWTRENKDMIGRFVGVLKVGAEAYVFWKVATMAQAAANWLLVRSTTATATATASVMTEEQILTAELLEQTAVVEANTLAWLSMTAAQREALVAIEALAVAQPQIVAGLGAGAAASAANAGTGAAYAAGGAMLSGMIIPVFIAGATVAAGEALGLWRIKSGWDALIPDALAIEFGTTQHSEDLRRIDAERKDRAALRSNPVPYASGWGDVTAMTGANRYLNPSLAAKYGVSLTPGKPTTNPELLNKGVSESDAITGSGRKQIIINVNAPMYKVDHQVNNSVQEGVDDMEQRVEEALLRVLQSANAAM